MSSNQITVLLQGPVHHPETKWHESISSIREFLPGARIIAVQWDHEPLAVDAETFRLKDPGPQSSSEGYSSNLWRQAYATQSALKSVSSTFVLKLRPDFLMTRRGRFTETDTLQERIRTLNVYTFNPIKRERLFWVSDMIQLGSTERLKQFWNVTEAETQTQFSRMPRPYWKYELGASDFTKSSEQLLTEKYLESLNWNLRRDALGRTIPNRENYQLALKCLGLVFDVVHWRDSGLTVPSRFQINDASLWLNSEEKDIAFVYARMNHFLNKERLINLFSGALRELNPSVWRRIRRAYLINKGAILA
jgi:hypothetical protein